MCLLNFSALEAKKNSPGFPKARQCTVFQPPKKQLDCEHIKQHRKTRALKLFEDIDVNNDGQLNQQEFLKG